MPDFLNIIELSALLRSNQITLTAADEKLRKYEMELSVTQKLLSDTAAELGDDLLEIQEVPGITSPEDACKLRYIVVPILYKLGYANLAAQLKQKTFEFLYPSLHANIEARVKELFGEDHKAQALSIIKLFHCSDSHIANAYARIKSTDSIWSKIGSLDTLTNISKSEFADIVDDFIGIRWNMVLAAEENRYDALLNGVRLIPLEGIKSFRNQQVKQSSGFDCEPVMKFTYVINGFPIELQLLGGQIEEYMCAKGYADYKTGMRFYPQKSDLSTEEWESRLGMCLYFSEHDEMLEYRRLMLNELMGVKGNYDNSRRFELDTEPSDSNKLLAFSGSPCPIYKLDNATFDSTPELLEIGNDAAIYSTPRKT